MRYQDLSEWWASLWFNRPEDDCFIEWMFDFTSHPLIFGSIFGGMFLAVVVIVVSMELHDAKARREQ